jgi:hypothetical protein
MFVAVRPMQKPTTTVVFFLGGCTYTEIAALRWVGRQNRGGLVSRLAVTAVLTEISSRPKVPHRHDGHHQRKQHFRDHFWWRAEGDCGCDWAEGCCDLSSFIACTGRGFGWTYEQFDLLLGGRHVASQRT